MTFLTYNLYSYNHYKINFIFDIALLTKFTAGFIIMSDVSLSTHTE